VIRSAVVNREEVGALPARGHYGVDRYGRRRSRRGRQRVAPGSDHTGMGLGPLCRFRDRSIDVRILITNDDGVFAPGIEALARGLAARFDGVHELVVVAPLVDYSGSGAAVGSVYERESIPYEAVQIPGLEHVATYGVDGPPALAVILACIEGFGPRPDLIVSGVNNGMNAGRSALHSGTVGAALTAAQFGLRGVAVSIAWASDPIPWETPVSVASDLVPVLAAAERGTVLNLNVPAVPLSELRGVRHGTLGRVGLIRSVRSQQTVDQVHSQQAASLGGAVTLTLRGGRGSDQGEEAAEIDPDSDAGLVKDGWASLTSILGVREDHSSAGTEVLAKALAEVQPR
jgi:5'-nucleotidase